MANLKSFLRTGELGPIRPGMSEAEVRQVLGQPNVWSANRDPILGYGALQLAFRGPSGGNAQLAVIEVSLSPAEVSAPPASVWPFEDFKDLSPETTLEQFRLFLTQAGFDDVRSHNIEDERVDLVILPARAWVSFDHQRLWSIHFIDPTPPKKQISLSVSQETLSQLTNLAQQRKKTIANLCTEWITQRANDLKDGETTSGAGKS